MLNRFSNEPMAFGKPLSFLVFSRLRLFPGRGREGSSKKGVKLDKDEGETFLDEMVVAEVVGGVLPLADNGNGVQGECCGDKTANLGDLIWTLISSTTSRVSAFPR